MSARYSHHGVFSALALSVVTSAVVWAQAPADLVPAPANAPPPIAGAPAAPAPQPADNGMEVLDQGPVHEAFAEPIVLDAKARVNIDREPPEPINELPPEVQPEGDNIQWIPGYWMWSDIKADFIWVSGVWRDVPPG